MKITNGVSMEKGRPVTVPAPTDYSARLEAARAHLRAKGRAAAIEPPQRLPSTVSFGGKVYRLRDVAASSAASPKE